MEEAEAVVRAIQKLGCEAKLVQADLQDADAAIKLAVQAWELTQGIDILVNNAGISIKRHFLDYTREEMNSLTSINFISTFFLTQAIAKNMVKSGTEGSIYTITSVNGIRPGIGLSGYGATKGALETLMQGVAVELAPHRINVNTIAVGAIETDMNSSVWKDPDAYQKVIAGIPLNRFGQPEEIAALVGDLICSGSYLTGASITVDGGLLNMRGYGKTEHYK
jgi:glucose 1-dehydrogenase